MSDVTETLAQLSEDERKDQENEARRDKLKELRLLSDSQEWKDYVAKCHDRADNMELEILEAVKSGKEVEKSYSEHEKDSYMLKVHQEIINEIKDFKHARFIVDDLLEQTENIRSGIVNGIVQNVGILSTRSAKFYSNIDVELRMVRGNYALMDQRLTRLIDSLTKINESDTNLNPYETPQA